MPPGVQVLGLDSGDQRAERALVGALLVAILHEGPARRKQWCQDQQAAERPHPSRHPQDDEQEPDDAVTDVGRAGGAQHSQDEPSDGGALAETNDSRQDQGVAQTLGHVREHQWKTDSQKKRRDTMNVAHIGRTTDHEVDEPSKSPVGRGHTGVECPHLNPVLVDPQQPGHCAHDRRPKGPDESH